MLPMVSPRPLEVRRSKSMLLLPSFTQKESSAEVEAAMRRRRWVMRAALVGGRLLLFEVVCELLQANTLIPNLGVVDVDVRARNVKTCPASSAAAAAAAAASMQT